MNTRALIVVNLETLQAPLISPLTQKNLLRMALPVVKMASLLFVLYNCAVYCSIYFTCDGDIQTIKIGCDRI